ncbi:hypothetical protein AB1Y20_019539 [Prymnesium parvum]|uniref:Hexosyltransferase n=1 Tax=Prymnesium parvum TaxID=97485 RepID=A0AB34JUQ5_PRYPA
MPDSQWVRRERAAAMAHNASNRAALIVYHELHPTPTPAGPLPPWARSAQRTASRLAPLLRTVLYTNAQDERLRRGFHRVVTIDLLGLARLRHVAPRALCGLKIFALLHGWSAGELPAEVLLLDADTVVLEPRLLLRMFAPLAHYDAAGVMEGYSRGWDGKDTARRDDSLATAPDPSAFGWEVNTGVLAIRRRAQWFVRRWADEFRDGLPLYSKLSGVDQSAFMWVLAHEPGARLFPMPPVFNFRAPVLYGRDLERPAVFHSRQAMRDPQRDHYTRAMMRVVQSVTNDLARKISGSTSTGSVHSIAGHGREEMQRTSTTTQLANNP